MQPGEPDIYIPPRTRCLYSVLIMHRRKDLWGPDGTSEVACGLRCLLMRFPVCVVASSDDVRSGPVPRRARTKVPRPESVHLPPFQRGAAYLSRTAGMFDLAILSPIACSLCVSVRITVRIQRNLIHARPPPPALLVLPPPAGRPSRGGAAPGGGAQPVCGGWKGGGVDEEPFDCVCEGACCGCGSVVGAGADGECTLQNGLWVEMDEVAQE